MARGWESKAIESQQADAAEQQSHSRPRMTSEQADLQRQIDGLDLSRRRTLHQIEQATDPRLRQMLENALADLDRRIQALKARSSSA